MTWLVCPPVVILLAHTCLGRRRQSKNGHVEESLRARSQAMGYRLLSTPGNH